MIDQIAEHTHSYYSATVNAHTQYPRLMESVTADVCIIGGGFSGVATALELSQRGYNVVLLEARKIGWGASGRNGGQLIRGIGHGTEQFRQQIGQEGIDAIGKMGIEAVDIVIDRIRQHGIACDLKMGYFEGIYHPHHQRALEGEYQELNALGYAHNLRWVGQSEIPELVGTERYRGGLFDAGSGHLHPLNLCIAEALLVEQKGSRLFEQSPVTHIDYGETVTVTTPQGTVKASQLVLCLNAYQGQLEPRTAKKVLPAGSIIIATEPLSASVYQQLLPTDAAVFDLGVGMEYFRLTADKRLLFGGGCNYSGREPKDIAHVMTPKMLQVFPQLRGINIDYAWAGMIGIGANRMPQIGRLEKNVYIAQGYAGHGVNATHIAGRVIAEAISGYSERFDVFNAIHHRSFPGGKLLRSPLLALGMLYHRFKMSLG